MKRKSFAPPLQTLKKKINNLHPAHVAGLFFCLASAEDAGLLFCPAAHEPHTSIYSGLYHVHAKLYRPRYKTAHMALQALFLLFAPFYRHRYQTGTSGYNTTCDTLERITAQQHIQRIPDTSRHAGRCTGQHRPPIIIRYIKGQRFALLLWIHARQCSRSQTMPARRG